MGTQKRSKSLRMKAFGEFSLGSAVLLVAVIHQSGSILLEMCWIYGSEAQWSFQGKYRALELSTHKQELKYEFQRRVYRMRRKEGSGQKAEEFQYLMDEKKR